MTGRPELTPPPLNDDKVEQLALLAQQIVDYIQSGRDTRTLVAEFNAQTNNVYSSSHFMSAAGSMSMHAFAQIALVPPIPYIADITREDLLYLVNRLLNFEGNAYQHYYWLGLLELHVPHPAVASLIYWPASSSTAETILEEALSYGQTSVSSPSSDPQAKEV